MSDEPQENGDTQRRFSSGSKRNRSFSFVDDVLNGPTMQLQKSLAAQQALLKPSFALPDLSAALQPPGLGAFQEIQRQLALRHSIQKTISSELANTSLTLRTAQNRILAEMQAITRVTDVGKSLQEALKLVSILPQIVSGRLLAEMRSIATSRVQAASTIRPYLDAITKVGELANNDILSSARAAVAAQSAIMRQLESVRQSGVFRSNLTGNLEAVRVRISAIKFDKLTLLAEEIAAKDALIADWTEENGEKIASQIESELAAIPESETWGMEKQVNYLIDWVDRHDDEEMKRNLVSFLINILAGVLLALSFQVASSVLDDDHGKRPQIIVHYVRQQIQEHPIHWADSAELRIVCKRAIPVKRSRRQRSQRIATLHAGSVVRAREKQGKWVHIEWTDFETGKAMEGWVFSKHLARVSKAASRSVSVETGTTSEQNLPQRQDR